MKNTLSVGICLLVIIAGLPVVTAEISDESPVDSHKAYTLEDEGDHFPTGVEWWWLYTTFTLDNGDEWDACIIFLYQMDWAGDQWSATSGKSYLRIQTWDRQTGEHYDYLHIGDHPGELSHKKNEVDLQYFDSTMSGVYPEYAAYAHDPDNDIILDIEFTAINPPHFYGTEPTDGKIPWGTGYAQYWTMPLGEMQGTITIRGEAFEVTGIGYQEHMFADAHLFDSFLRKTSFDKLFHISQLYTSISRWMLVENIRNRVLRLDYLHLSTDNIAGYDWLWIGFEEGWSAVICRLNGFAVDDGQSIGILVVSNGEEYWEFGAFCTKVTKEEYLGERDMYLPMDFEITAKKGDKEFTVEFTSTTNITRMYIQNGLLEFGNFLAAGHAKGSFKDGDEVTSLTGKGTNTPLRYIPKLLWHQSSDFDWILPPYGFGFIAKRKTHLLGIEIIYKVQLSPIIDVDFSIRPSPGGLRQRLLSFAH